MSPDINTTRQEKTTNARTTDLFSRVAQGNSTNHTASKRRCTEGRKGRGQHAKAEGVIINAGFVLQKFGRLDIFLSGKGEHVCTTSTVIRVDTAEIFSVEIDFFARRRMILYLIFGE